MRIVVRGAGAVVALVAALLASGCAPSGPQPTPRPSPSATPLFESDEEALAAAEEAYAAYLRVSDQITSEGGVNPERVDPLIGDDIRPGVHESFAKYRDRNIRTTGATSLNFVSLQSVQVDRHTVIDAYICIDVSEVRVVDSSGADITPESRASLVPLVVTFHSNSGPDRLIIERSEPWGDDSMCV
jgi:hypothetical protein